MPFSIFIALLFVVSAVALIGSLVALLFKNQRWRAKRVALASAVLLVLSVVLIVQSSDEEARAKGFLNLADLQAATRAGVVDVAVWTIQRQKVEAEKAAAAKSRAEEVAAAAEAQAALLRPPLQERQFIEAIRNAQSQYKTGSNDLQKGAARPTRARLICSVMPETRASDWIGTVADLSTNGDGEGVLSITISEGAQLKTHNNSVSDYRTNTLIKANSSLYHDLLKVKIGETVRFSGAFFAGSIDCFQELSMTLAGSITEPEFLFRFSRVERLAPPTQSARR